ncbi:MAG TPA: FAD-dependent oxidoreductase [Casimicrobiaceae bacterium]|jgi:thioredoxin reductase (NADPH)|nr:FAD-dependent oxidoreductase [Casimicrobiaceae bacterium]
MHLRTIRIHSDLSPNSFGMITPELLRGVPLFAEVPERKLEVIASRAADIRLRPNDWLIREGELPSFFIVLSGGIDVVKILGDDDRVINHFGVGEYAGEVPLLLFCPAIASLRATETSRVARFEAADFHELIASSPRLNTMLMRTMAERIGRVQDFYSSVAPTAAATVIGHRYDVSCHQLRDFLTRNHVTFRWHDLRDREAREALGTMFEPEGPFPVVILPGGTRLVAPSFREVAQALGLQTMPSEGVVYDVAIIGAGPAGLASAVYGASEGLRTILIERHAPGGQASTSSRIENYLGFPTGVSGDDLGSRALQQAKRFGVEILVGRNAEAIKTHCEGQVYAVLLEGGGEFRTRAIVIASGVSWRQLDVAGADRLVGRGLYYGASRTEGPSTSGHDIFLIGGGNSAGQAAMFFADYARSVTLLVRGPSLAATMSHYLIQQLATKSNIHVETGSQVAALEGEDHLESILIEHRATGERSRKEAEAVFAFIGADAETGWLPVDLCKDERGYVCTGRDVMDIVARNDARWPLERDPYLLETNVPGVFAVGDVRHGSIKRVASGVGEGSMAIAFVHQYLAEQREVPTEERRRERAIA